MDWTQAVDGYCERLGPGLWAEPWNLVSNLAFVLAGLLMWRRTAGMPAGRLLSAVLVVIGIGSGTFHSVAQRWAGMADVVPILVFVLIYMYLAGRDYLRLRPIWAGLATACVVPYALVTAPLFALIPNLGSSAGYAPLPILIFLVAAILATTSSATAGGLALGAVLLMVSLAFRTIDNRLCTAFPTGTHFIWHLLNALMLAWMIEVWRRHRLEGAAEGG